MKMLMAIMLLSLAGATFAGECDSDAIKFCKDVPARSKRACLKKHQNELSAVCQNKIKKVKETFDLAKKACKKDIETLCKGGKRKIGGIPACLKANEARLSPGCRDLRSKKESL